MHYDLVILGGGPGGYWAAERAAKAELNVALIEKNKLGGTCLNEGCIPSKAFLQSAKVADYIRHAALYGVDASLTEIKQKTVTERKNRIMRKLVGGIKAALRDAGVTVVEGFGKLVKTPEGLAVNANGENYFGKDIIVATGSVSAIPPIPGVKEGLENGTVLTNKEILDLTAVPKSLVVIGGGVIGLEMASYYNSVGSKVTVIEMLNSIAGQTDAEISEMLKSVYAKKGIQFILGAKVTAVSAEGVTYELDGKTSAVPAHKVLMSVGRKPNTASIGLEEAGVETARGAVVTDNNMRTNIPHIYAVGDVNAKVMLAHTAYREADVAVNTILGVADEMSYAAIPSVIYTNPEVACAGLTAEQAKDKGIDAKTVALPMQFSGRFVAENTDLDGICKLVVDNEKNILLGVHMMGNGASEIIYGAAMMIGLAVDIETIKRQIFPHPTVGEIIREGIFHI